MSSSRYSLPLQTFIVHYLFLLPSPNSPSRGSLTRSGINDISLAPDGLYFSTASDDGTALVFATDPLVEAVTRAGDDDPPFRAQVGATPLRALTGHTAPVLSVAYGPRANLLVTGSFDESAIVWDVRRGRALRTLPAHADAIWTVGWDAEGALVITGSADGLM